MSEGYQMAERLGFFERRPDKLDLDDDDQITSASYAAWAIYNWLV
jgi:hypothetical protein